jgi:hypothetical protein
MWSVSRSYREGAKLKLSHFCVGVCEGGTWAREAEASPLLEAITSKRLVKTQQAGKDLASAMVICELWW